MSKKSENEIFNVISGLTIIALSICLICVAATTETDILILTLGIITLIVGATMFTYGLKTMIITYS